jgi:hypothetical protein
MIAAFLSARRPDDPTDRTGALLALLPHVSETGRKGLREEIVEEAAAVDDVDRRADILIALASRLSAVERADALERAVAAARSISIPWRRGRALASLVPLLPESQRGNVIEEALEAGRIGNDLPRLIALASYLSEAQSQAFVSGLLAGAALQRNDDRVRASLEGIVALPATRWTMARDLLAALLDDLPGIHRRLALLALRNWMPNVALLGGERAIVQTLETVRDIGKWWR